MAYFYYYFRPLVIALKLVGLFPIDNVFNSDPKYLTFKRMSLSGLYSTLSLGFYILMALYFSGNVFYIPGARERCLQLVCLLSLIRSILSLILFIKSAKKLPILINLLHAYDRKKEEFQIGKNSSDLRKFVIWTFVPLTSSFLVCVIIGFFFSVLMGDILMPSVRDTTNANFCRTFFSLLIMWHVLPLTVYLYLSCKIWCNFSELNESLTQNKFNVYLDKENKFMDYDKISTFRYLHNMLSECVYNLAYAYGSFLALDQLCVIIVTVINIAVILIIATKDTYLLLLTGTSIILTLAVILTSERIKTEGNEIVNIIHRMPTKNISEECLKELHTFMVQIHVRPIEISASGYFILDKKQILNIISQVATYLIVVCQLVQNYYTSVEKNNENSTIS